MWTSICLVALFGSLSSSPLVVLAAGVTSKLNVQLPQELRKEGGYDHREALFGLPPYGGSIQQNLYYADSTMCDSNEDYSRGGYPTRGNDSSGQMAAWKAPFILMVDRGDCTFVKKVRNAQKLGAAGVIIADNTCLCDAGDACKSNAGDCETKEPIMADDGSGADITIPSFLMFKQDADPIIETLKKNTIVRMSMSWGESSFRCCCCLHHLIDLYDWSFSSSLLSSSVASPR
jgi:hypothetical protein